MARKCDFRAPASLTSAFNEVTISLVSARKRDYKRVALIGYYHEPGPCMIVGCELTLQNRGGVLSFGFYRVRLRYLVRFYSLSRVLSFPSLYHLSFLCRRSPRLINMVSPARSGRRKQMGNTMRIPTCVLAAIALANIASISGQDWFGSKLATGNLTGSIFTLVLMHASAGRETHTHHRYNPFVFGVISHRRSSNMASTNCAAGLVSSRDLMRQIPAQSHSLKMKSCPVSGLQRS